MVTDWTDALCADDPDAMFVTGAAQNIAKRLCVPCPIRQECLTYAIAHDERHGVWGGLTERERNLLTGRTKNAPPTVKRDCVACGAKFTGTARSLVCGEDCRRTHALSQQRAYYRRTRRSVAS